MENETIVCQSCHATVPLVGKFCPKCGSPFPIGAYTDNNVDLNATTVLSGNNPTLAQPYSDPNATTVLSGNNPTLAQPYSDPNATTVLSGNNPTPTQPYANSVSAAGLNSTSGQFGANNNFTPVNQPNPSAPINNFGQQQAGYQPPVNAYMPAKKKGLRWWQIVLIVIVGIFVLFFLVGIIAGISDSKRSSTSGNGNGGYVSSSSNSTTKSAKVAYTKGSIQNGYYVNGWADIKLPITDDWPNGNDTAYTAPSSNSEYGFISINDIEGYSYKIVFENLSSDYVSYTSQKYFDVCEKSIKESYDEEAGISYTTERFSKAINSGDYLCEKFFITYNSRTIYQYICVRVVDNHGILLMLTSLDEKDINAFLDAIEPAKQ